MKPRASALVPFLVFAVFYVGLSLYARHLGFDMPWYKVPMPVAFLGASASAFLWGRRSLDEKVETFAKGLGLSIDSLSLIKSLYYQPLLALAVMVSILLPRRQKAN